MTLSVEALVSPPLVWICAQYIYNKPEAISESTVAFPETYGSILVPENNYLCLPQSRREILQ
jgi:hypothetical protein